MDVNKEVVGHQYDRVNIICPYSGHEGGEGERHIIYSVDREDYDLCRVSGSHRQVGAHQASIIITMMIIDHLGGPLHHPHHHYHDDH